MAKKTSSFLPAVQHLCTSCLQTRRTASIQGWLQTWTFKLSRTCVCTKALP